MQQLLKFDVFGKSDVEVFEDRLHVLEKKSVFGALFSILLVPTAVIITVQCSRAFAEDRFITASTTQWSAGSDYPINLRCRNAGGCFISQFYTGVSSQSSDCSQRSSFACTFLAPDEVLSTKLCFSSFPEDGLVVSHSKLHPPTHTFPLNYGPSCITSGTHLSSRR